MRLIALSLILVLLSSSVAAWGPVAHEKLAERVCLDFACECMAEVINGSYMPEGRYTDNSVFRCYTYPWNCQRGKWDCPKYSDCPALRISDDYLDEARNASGCEQWRLIGLASHYFFTAQEFWHKVKDSNYQKCQKPFEEAVEIAFASGAREWQVCQCDACVNYSAFDPQVKEFEAKLDFVESKRRIILLANSLDFALAAELVSYLEENRIDVVHVTPLEFPSYKLEKQIVVLGGQNSPEGVGEIVSTLLTNSEQEALLSSSDSKAMYAKKDLWAEGQVIQVLAGREKEQTQAAWTANKEELASL